MKRFTFLVLCIVLIAGCTPKAPATPETISSPTIAAPVATTTPEPTATTIPSPTPTPLPDPISAENGAKLVESNRLGDGRVIDLMLSPDGTQVLVSTTTGLGLYDSEGHQAWKVDTGPIPLDITYKADGKTISVIYPGGLVENRDASSGEVIDSFLETKDNINFALLARDGEKAFLSDVNFVTTLYDVASGNPIFTNDGSAVAYDLDYIDLSDDGKMALISGWPGSDSFVAQVWDAEKGTFSYGLRDLMYYMYDLQFTPNSKYLAAYAIKKSGENYYSTLYLWNTTGGEIYTAIDFETMITDFAISADGRTAYVTNRFKELIAKVDIEDAKRMRDDAKKSPTDLAPLFYEPEYLSGHADYPLRVVTDTNNEQLLSLDANGVIKIWNMANDENTSSFKLNISNDGFTDSGIAFSADTTSLARSTLNAENIEIINVADGKVSSNIMGTKGYRYWGFAFSKDGKFLSAADNDKNVNLWELKSKKLTKKIASEHRYEVLKTQFHPDGDLLASMARGQIFFWDDNGEKKADMGGWSCMDFSPDGKTLAFDNADYGIYLVETLGGKRLASPAAEYLFDLVYSPDGKTIGLAGWQVQKRQKDHVNLVYFMDGEKPYERHPIELQGFASSVKQIAFSPDGTLLAAVDDYGSLYLYTVESGEKLAKLDAGLLVEEMAFTSDSRTLLVGGKDATITYFEIERGK